MPVLAGWENFYVIVGSSAGALIGLQFVVITLIASRPVVKDQSQAGEAFATPTVVHFGAVLLLSATAAAPWRGITGLAVVWGVLGLIGVAYEIVVARRMQLQDIYKPQFEDWLFHVLLPFAAYATLAASAYAIRSSASIAMFGAGAAALLLLFVGIHNAWDGVTYHIFTRQDGGHKGKQRNE
jgi:hypothetical protein